MPTMSDPNISIGCRVGVDTGGTFTDLLLIDPAGQVQASCKVLSTPADPGKAVLAGIDRLLAGFEGDLVDGRACPLSVADLKQVVHGSTVATNALLERKTDPAALVTTAGFEDLLTLARQDRSDLYALSPRRTNPPIPRGHTIGVVERVGYDGSVLTTLTQHEVDRVVDELVELGVAAVAVCLLHSYANSTHERQLADAIRERLPAVHLTVSSALLPELREYERASTCAVNAVVGPTMSRYIDRLDEALGKGKLRIMASGGGTLPPGILTKRPVESVVSGPAGGVIGAWAMAQSVGEDRIIGFDMGGTSTDVSLCDGGPTQTTETMINGLPIRLPMIDIHTVGAGGGSIAWIDAGGALRVGPESAGADPGPACYGRQGASPEHATVTDAHAVLGHLRQERALGEAIKVDTDAAREAVGKLAAKLGLSIEAAAEGILRVADAAMARAIQRVSVQRGHDARDFAMVAFGGAGGLHACRLAELLGMKRVLMPVNGGLLSAFGMLAAPARHAFSQAAFVTLEHDGHGYENPEQVGVVSEAFDRLRRRCFSMLEEEGHEGIGWALDLALDLRFAGQSFEITIQVGDDDDVIDRFLAEHTRLYGYVPEQRAIEVVAARASFTGPMPVLSPGLMRQPTVARNDVETLAVFEGGETRAWRRVVRSALMQGDELTGPAVIEEYAATTLVLNGWVARVLDDGQLLMESEGGGKHG